MATRTVSAAGGLFNNVGTWVGGVVPIANDDIIANATSGNLTIGSNTVNLSGANFTGYTGTLALGAQQMNFITGAALNTGTTMTITSSGVGGRFQWQAGGSIVSTGVVNIPWIQLSSNATLSISGVVSITGGIVSNSITITGGDIIWRATAGPDAFCIVNSPRFVFIRPTTSITFANSLGFSRIAFDTTSSVTFNGSALVPGTVQGANAPNTYIRFDQTPTFPNGVLITYQTNASATHTIDVATSSVKIDRLSTEITGASTNTSFVFPTNTNIGKLLTRAYLNAGPATTVGNNTLISTSNVSIDELVVTSSYGSMTSLTSESLVLSSVTAARRIGVRFSSGATWSIANVNCSGVSPNGSTTPTTTFSSMTASVPATISIGATFSFDNTQIIDINNIGTPAYAFSFAGNTITRTTGITSSFPSSGGGAGGSFTFVS